MRPLIRQVVRRPLSSLLRRPVIVYVGMGLAVVAAVALFASALVDEPVLPTEFWDVEVHLHPKATFSEIDGVGATLNDDPLVDALSYVSKDARLKELRGVYRDDPEVAAAFKKSELPPSFVALVRGRQSVMTVQRRARALDGVLSVTFAGPKAAPAATPVAYFPAAYDLTAQPYETLSPLAASRRPGLVAGLRWSALAAFVLACFVLLVARRRTLRERDAELSAPAV